VAEPCHAYLPISRHVVRVLTIRRAAPAGRAITRVADATVADDFGVCHAALAEHFSQEEILEIIGIVINMNVWTRLKLAEGATPGLAEQTMS
jgi:alkylhydroperoxidase family enzyme